MATKASQTMHVLYMVKPMYLASLKFSGILRVLNCRKQTKKKKLFFLFCSKKEVKENNGRCIIIRREEKRTYSVESAQDDEQHVVE